MAFTGKEGEQITLQEGSQMTANYRAANPGEITGYFMGSEILNEILCQPDCVGIRTYYALDNNGQKQMVFVGVDQNEIDISTGIVADRGQMSQEGNPPSPLN